MTLTVDIVHARTAQQVRAWLAAVGAPRFVAVDTETSGWDEFDDQLLLVQVSAGPAHPVLVLDARAVPVAVLAGLLADPAVLKVFHHGAFDLRFLAVAGVAVERVADTMLAQQLLDGGAPGPTGNGLADLARFRLGVELDKAVRAEFARAGPVTDRQVRYAADDAAATWAVFDQQRDELIGHGLRRVAQLEFAALPALVDLRLRGAALDVQRWSALVGELEARLPALEQDVQQALVTPDSPRTLFGPEPVNLDSPEQLLAALARLGLELPSTREAVLRDHRGVAAVDALLAYRQVSKITANWGGDWARRVAHPRTGRVHADWRQIVGGGRIGCSDPNLTQIPRDARYRCCFGGQPGRRLVVADYSQQELRILAAVSGDEALTGVFRAGGDLHASTAAAVFGIPPESVDAARRQAAKALNFGLLYGMRPAGFARATGMGVAAAKEAIDAYFRSFPRVSAWLRDVEATARRTGRVRTPLGRLRVLDPAAGVVTLARNAPIQGAGADMTKLALAAVRRRLGAAFPHDPTAAAVAPAGAVLVVHDELVVEAAAEHADEVAREVVAGMTAAAAEILGDVPAHIDVAVRDRWAPIPPPVTER